MNVAIVGYGRMGKQIEKVLKSKGIKVGSIIDKFSNEATFKDVNKDSLDNIDVAVDFTTPDSVIDNIKQYIDNNVSIVMGTTGWFDKLDKVEKMVSNKIGFIWSGNFSIGVHIFFRIVKESAKIFNNFPEYDPMMYEIHHNQKKDSPSGTAKMISDIIIKELSSKNKSVEDKLDRKIEDSELHVASVRGGSVPGTHTVMFDSPVDTVELKHSARNREGFASGAVLAAEWIKDKKGFYSIDDLMESMD